MTQSRSDSSGEHCFLPALVSTEKEEKFEINISYFYRVQRLFHPVPNDANCPTVVFLSNLRLLFRSRRLHLSQQPHLKPRSDLTPNGRRGQ